MRTTDHVKIKQTEWGNCRPKRHVHPNKCVSRDKCRQTI